ncbi:uncharacterized protein LOC119848780 [Dermochelys coriacea]|uniref:uncharacterized protein LOC119848780 n=1 Tax=Dermochelys coriacea TaxID=27794 RepID=UPI001CA8C403|nr:uncharacterized protein LOC119848780 [Dermochelys coriacea]
MTEVLLLFSLLAGVAALALPGEPPECLQGPEFWCRDVATAAHCGQLQFCLEYDWDELPKDADEREPLVKCWVCKRVISKLKKMVSKTHNEQRGKGHKEDLLHIHPRLGSQVPPGGGPVRAAHRGGAGPGHGAPRHLRLHQHVQEPGPARVAGSWPAPGPGCREPGGCLGTVTPSARWRMSSVWPGHSGPPAAPIAPARRGCPQL